MKGFGFGFGKGVVVCIVIAAASTTAMGQFVKVNEAVKFVVGGGRMVETPPLPAGTLAAPCPATKSGCAVSGWRMVETADGLRECTEIYARPGTCRASTYGTEKRSRLWIVKTAGQWMQCQRPDLSSMCVSTKSFPYAEVQ